MAYKPLRGLHHATKGRSLLFAYACVYNKKRIHITRPMRRTNHWRTVYDEEIKFESFSLERKRETTLSRLAAEIPSLPPPRTLRLHPPSSQDNFTLLLVINSLRMNAAPIWRHRNLRSASLSPPPLDLPSITPKVCNARVRAVKTSVGIDAPDIQTSASNLSESQLARILAICG